jgi:hypothetical protein
MWMKQMDNKTQNHSLKFNVLFSLRINYTLVILLSLFPDTRVWGRERKKYRFTFFASEWFYDFSMFTILIAPAIKIPFIINFSLCAGRQSGMVSS